jgi:predicted aldo/keto reductase-like oxidoreductase
MELPKRKSMAPHSDDSDGRSRADARGGFDRRTFLRGTAATGVALSWLPLAAGAADPPRVRRRVTLGRTGLEVPDIGFGSSRLRDDETLVRHALDRGIDYFDTAADYTGGASEETLGRALAGVREQVTLATKVEAEAHHGVFDLMGALEGSLRRLRTDRVEIYFNHAVNDMDRLRNDAWGEFVTRAKEQGKIRFTGMSGHGGRLAECLDYAFDHDLVDVVLVAHNFGQDPAFYEQLTRSLDFVAIQPELPRLLAKAKEKNVGVVAMKTLRGAKLNEMRPYEQEGGTFAQAAFRWVLAGPHVDALVVTMTSSEMVDEYLGASGATRVSRADLALLAAYESREGATQCRYGCGTCLSACPEQVPIDAVLRTRMYAEDYGEPELARGDYAKLGAGASACVGCAHRACAGACPYGIDIGTLTARTHGRLG